MPTKDPRLSAFLIRLSEDPAFLAEFQRSPHKTMANAQLSMAHQKLILQKDAAKINVALRGHETADEPDGGAPMIILNAVIVSGPS